MFLTVEKSDPALISLWLYKVTKMLTGMRNFPVLRQLWVDGSLTVIEDDFTC